MSLCTIAVLALSSFHGVVCNIFAALHVYQCSVLTCVEWSFFDYLKSKFVYTIKTYSHLCLFSRFKKVFVKKLRMVKFREVNIV